MGAEDDYQTKAIIRIRALAESEHEREKDTRDWLFRVAGQLERVNLADLHENDARIVWLECARISEFGDGSIADLPESIEILDRADETLWKYTRRQDESYVARQTLAYVIAQRSRTW
jgi:hypothetical protein